MADPLPLVLFSPPCNWRQPLLDSLDRRWRVAFQSTSVHAVQAAIAAGLGVGALLPANVPAGTTQPDLPAPPRVDITISRAAGPDPAIDSLERLLRRALAD